MQLRFPKSKATQLHLTKKIFGQSQNFSGSHRKILGKQKIFDHKKLTTFTGQSFQI